MAIHSLNDCTVNIEAARRLRNSWLQLYGTSPTPVERINCTAEGVACEQSRFGTSQRSTVETVFYQGERGNVAGQGSHYWVGDNAGPFANPQGPSASALSMGVLPAASVLARTGAHRLHHQCGGGGHDRPDQWRHRRRGRFRRPGRCPTGWCRTSAQGHGPGYDKLVGHLRQRTEQHTLHSGRDRGGQRRPGDGGDRLSGPGRHPSGQYAAQRIDYPRRSGAGLYYGGR